MNDSDKGYFISLGLAFLGGVYVGLKIKKWLKQNPPPARTPEDIQIDYTTMSNIVYAVGLNALKDEVYDEYELETIIDAVREGV